MFSLNTYGDGEIVAFPSLSPPSLASHFRSRLMRKGHRAYLVSARHLDALERHTIVYWFHDDMQTRTICIHLACYDMDMFCSQQIWKIQPSNHWDVNIWRLQSCICNLHEIEAEATQSSSFIITEFGSVSNFLTSKNSSMC